MSVACLNTVMALWLIADKTDEVEFINENAMHGVQIPRLPHSVYVDDRVSWAHGSSQGVQEALSSYLRSAMIEDAALGFKANLDKFKVAANRAELRRRLRRVLPGISAEQGGNTIVMLGIDYHMAGNMPRIHKKRFQKPSSASGSLRSWRARASGGYGPSLGDTSGELGNVRGGPHDARNSDNGGSIHEGHSRRRQQRSPIPQAAGGEELGEVPAEGAHGEGRLGRHA